MADLKIQGEISLDASKADQAFAKVDASAKKMADGVRKSGADAGKGLEGVGDGLSKSVVQMGREEKRFSALIKKSTFELQTLGKTASQKFEARLEYRGLDPSKFRADLDALRAAEAQTRAIDVATGNWYSSVERIGPLLASAFTGAALLGLGTKLVSVQREFDVLNSSLKTVAGGSAAAEREMSWLKDFAKETPFGLAQATQGFVKMKALGLDPTRDALTSFGNTASAMGKDLNQMVEAVADASTSEFERLKEFGIKAKKEGDNVSLTFQGVTTTIRNNSAEIVKYLQNIGNTQFAGAMEERAKTLDGSISALGDTWDELFRTINERNAGTLIADSVGVATGAIEQATVIINAMSSAVDESGRQTGAMASIVDGIGTVFETAAVLGANLKYVLTAVGTEIGGLAAQVAQAAQFNFAGVAAIRAQMVADAQAARAEIDATERRILGARKAQEDYAAFATRNASAAMDPRRLDLPKPTGSTATTGPDRKEIADANRELKEQAKLIAELSGLTGSFYEDWNRLATMFGKGKLDLAGLTEAQAKLLGLQPFMKTIADAQKKAAEEEARALQEAVTGYADLIEARENLVAKAQAEVSRERDIAMAIGLTRVQIAELEAAKLDESATARERLAVVADEADLSGRLAQTYRDEARALRDLAAAKRGTATRQNTYDEEQRQKEAAKRAEQEWQKSITNIDNIFRQGFADMLNGGEDAWGAFTKSLKTTFMTTVADEIYKAFARPFVVNIAANLLGGSGSAGGLLGTAGGTNGGNGVLGMANNLSSLYGAYQNGTGYLNTIGSWFGLGGGAAAASATTVSSAAQLGAGFEAYMASQGIGASAGATAAGAGAGAASVVPIIGWILAGIGASSSLYGKGYSVNGFDDGIVTPAAASAKLFDKVLRGIGISDKWADILSTGPLLDKALDLFGISGGERRFGGQYGLSAESDAVLNARRGTYVDGVKGQLTFLEGPSGGQFAREEVGTLIGTTVESINGLFKALESDARIADVWAGLETSTNDRGGVFFGGRTNQGMTFGETSWESTSSRSPNAQEAYENLTLDAQQGLLQALQSATDLPKSIAAYLKTLTPEEMDREAITKALTDIGQQAKVIADFRDALKTLPFENLKALSYDTAELLIQAAGGLDSLNSGLSGYFENFYSEAERVEVQTASMTKAIAELGLQMPDLAQGADTARAQFRALVEAQDVSTEEGRSRYVALLNLQGAFAGLTPVIDATSEALRQAEEAARAAQAALTERTRLEDQLLQAQGNSDAIRERELARLLNDENRDLQRQIWATQDQTAAAQAAAAAAEEAARAQAELEAAYRSTTSAAHEAYRAMQDAWQGIADNLIDEVKRIRGEMLGDTEQGMAFARSRFTIATAQARAGDQTAAESLPELSRQVLQLAKTTAGSALELQLMQAEIAASLTDTTRQIGRTYGINVPAFAAGGWHSGGSAIVGERGPELVYTPPSQIFNASQTGDILGNREVVAELKALREDGRSNAADIARLNLRTARVLEKWDVDGMPEVTT